MDIMTDKHYYEVDCHKHGDHGFKKLNDKTGKEDIRGLEIPTSDKRRKELIKAIEKRK